MIILFVLYSLYILVLNILGLHYINEILIIIYYIRKSVTMINEITIYSIKSRLKKHAPIPTRINIIILCNAN